MGLLALSVDKDYASTSQFQRVNSLTPLRSHLNVESYFWSNLLNVDVNYSSILSFYCSGYLKCIEKNIVNYTNFDNFD